MRLLEHRSMHMTFQKTAVELYTNQSSSYGSVPIYRLADGTTCTIRYWCIMCLYGGAYWYVKCIRHIFLLINKKRKQVNFFTRGSMTNQKFQRQLKNKEKESKSRLSSNIIKSKKRQDIFEITFFSSLLTISWSCGGPAFCGR